MPKKIVHIDGVGDVLFRHSDRAHHLRITVKPFTGAVVSIPPGMSYQNAARFVIDRRLWIKKHLTRMKEFESMQSHFDENSSFSTRSHKLNLQKEERENISIRISKGKINIAYPAGLDPESNVLQSAIKRGIERALRLEAKEYLPGKVRQLADRYGFRYNKLTIKNIKSRWGSCSRKNNINLSIHLMRLPDHLIDYVILHELVHTVHHNHSTKFWNLLDDVTHGAKLFEKELRKSN